jgi:riboflavin synthase
MFTGIVQQSGRVARVRTVPFGAILEVDPRGWSYRPEPGASIAVNGCCLTVTEPDAGGGSSDDLPPAVPGGLRFDVIRQTLDVTTLGDLGRGDPVNLEPAVTPTTLLGGHIVQGHVDGVAIACDVQRSESEWRVRVEPPPPLMEWIVEKGSVALDGVSLTVARSGDAWFEVALIPTTLELTTLGGVEVGARLNLETDYVAKTVVHWLRRREEASG